MRQLVYGTLLACSLLSSAAMPAFAQDTSDKDVAALLKALEKQSAQLAAQEKKLDDSERELENQRRNFQQQKMQFQKLQTQVSTVTGKKIPAANAVAKKETVSDYKSDNKTASNTNVPEEVGVEKKQSTEKPPEIAAIIDEGGVLTQKGKLVVTPAIEYDRSSALQVAVNGFSIIPALNIGTFDISQVNRDIVTPSLDLRYGITNRFEIEAKVPYVYRLDSTIARRVGIPNAPETLNTASGEDIGDVEFGAHYQLNEGSQGWPYFVANLRFKTVTGTSPFDVPIVNGVEARPPTGSGFYAIQPSVTMLYPTDPVVYYSNFGYLHSFERSFSNYGTITPGDGFSGSFGMSLSLNDKSSVSLGYSHTTVMKTQQNNVNITNGTVLQVGSVDLGFSYNLSEKTNLNFTVSTGVTSDAPDVRLIFRVPMTFDLF